MSFWRHFYHIVWATKNRMPMLTPDIRPGLYDHIVDKASKMGIIVHAIGGVDDHIHLVVSIPPTQTVAAVVGALKGESSFYINNVLKSPDQLLWQRGYGSLTIGEKRLSTAIAYVNNQVRHHADTTTNSWLERDETA